MMTQNEKLLAVRLLGYAVQVDEFDEENYRTNDKQTFTTSADSVLVQLTNMFTFNEVQEIKGIVWDI